jgi:hypothetical protein
MIWFTSPKCRRNTDAKRPRANRFVPRLEGLEECSVPSALTVANTLDSGAGSLRDTISNGKDGETIVFDPGLNGQTITLTSDQLTINPNFPVQGARRTADAMAPRQRRPWTLVSSPCVRDLTGVSP